MHGVGNNEKLDSNDEETSESPGEEARSKQHVAAAKRPRLSKRQKEKWTKGDCPSLPVRFFPDFDAHQYRDFSPSELFRLFIDDGVLERIQKEMMLYARLKSDIDLSVTKEEILTFLSILVVSGYCQLPSRRMFWEEEDDCRNILVSEAMRRNRFEKILRYIHIANDHFNHTDSYWKLRALISILQKRFMKHYVPTHFPMTRTMPCLVELTTNSHGLRWGSELGLIVPTTGSKCRRCQASTCASRSNQEEH